MFCLLDTHITRTQSLLSQNNTFPYAMGYIIIVAMY